MNCSRCETLLSDYMDSALDGPVRVAAEKHFESCRQCRMLLEEIRLLRVDLDSFPELPVPEGAVERILELTTGLPQRRSFWSDLFLPTVRPFLTQRFAFATGIMFVFLSLMVSALGPEFSSLSNDQPASLGESGARVAGKISARWYQFKDARARFFEELSLWAEDVVGRLDYHLVTNLFESYEDSVQKQQDQLQQKQDAPKAVGGPEAAPADKSPDSGGASGETGPEK